MKRNHNNQVSKKYDALYRKYRISKGWFVFLNIFSFALIAGVVIANYYAIRKDEIIGDLKPIFILMSVITSVVGLIAAIASFFTLRKNESVLKGKYEQIEHEYIMFKNKEAPYDKRDAKEKVISEVMRVYNGEDEKK